MPLPLPIMIPFMMWQSAAIAAGFGTYFQYAKRRISAMSNEEFNASNPHDLVNAMYDELIQAMPSSFKKIETLTPIILDSMLKMLTDATDWFAGILGGTGLTELQRRLAGGDPLNPLLPGGGGELDGGTETPTVELPRSSFSENTIKTWSLITLTERKSQPFIGTVDVTTQNLTVKYFIIRRDEAKKRQSVNAPTKPLIVIDYTIPPQKFINNLQIIALNKMIKLKQFRNYYIILNARWATADRSIKTARSKTDRDRWINIKNAWTKIILDSNKNLPRI